MPQYPRLFEGVYKGQIVKCYSPFSINVKKVSGRYKENAMSPEGIHYSPTNNYNELTHVLDLKCPLVLETDPSDYDIWVYDFCDKYGRTGMLLTEMLNKDFGVDGLILICNNKICDIIDFNPVLGNYTNNDSGLPISKAPDEIAEQNAVIQQEINKEDLSEKLINLTTKKKNQLFLLDNICYQIRNILGISPDVNMFKLRPSQIRNQNIDENTLYEAMSLLTKVDEIFCNLKSLEEGQNTLLLDLPYINLQELENQLGIDHSKLEDSMLGEFNISLKKATEEIVAEKEYKNAKEERERELEAKRKELEDKENELKRMEEEFEEKRREAEEEEFDKHLEELSNKKYFEKKFLLKKINKMLGTEYTLENLKDIDTSSLRGEDRKNCLKLVKKLMVLCEKHG